MDPPGGVGGHPKSSAFLSNSFAFLPLLLPLSLILSVSVSPSPVLKVSISLIFIIPALTSLLPSSLLPLPRSFHSINSLTFSQVLISAPGPPFAHCHCLRVLLLKLFYSLLQLAQPQQLI